MSSPTNSHASLVRAPAAIVAAVFLIVFACVAGLAVSGSLPQLQRGPALEVDRTGVILDAGLVLASIHVTANPDCSPLPRPLHSCPIVIPPPQPPSFLSVWVGYARSDPTHFNAGNFWHVLRLPLP